VHAAGLKLPPHDPPWSDASALNWALWRANPTLLG
jgi:hypothetical protein